jgi:hypothetical protein
LAGAGACVRGRCPARCQIGPDAHDRECAAEWGLALHQVRNPECLRAENERVRRDWEASQERRAAQEAEWVTWRGGHKHIDGVPQYDANGAPIMLLR